MTNPTPETPPIIYARIAGFLYLMIIGCGLFSEMYVRSSLIVPGDATTTANNIVASELLFRLGFASDLVMLLSDIGVCAIFYILFKPVSHILSLVAAFFRLAQTAILGMNLLNYFTVLLILGGSDYLTGFNPEQLHGLVLLFLNAHKSGYDLGLVFFGVHCLVLGYLLFKSDYFPNILGILVGLASLGYLTNSFTSFVFPNYAALISPVLILPVIAEFSLCLWLLIPGFKFKPE